MLQRDKLKSCLRRRKALNLLVGRVNADASRFGMGIKRFGSGKGMFLRPSAAACLSVRAHGGLVLYCSQAAVLWLNRSMFCGGSRLRTNQQSCRFVLVCPPTQTTMQVDGLDG